MTLDDLLAGNNVWTKHKKKVAKDHCKDRRIAPTNPCKGMKPIFSMTPIDFHAFALTEQDLTPDFPEFYEKWSILYKYVYKERGQADRFIGDLNKYQGIYNILRATSPDMGKEFLKKGRDSIKSCVKSSFISQYLDYGFELAEKLAHEDANVGYDFMRLFPKIVPKYNWSNKARHLQNVLALVDHIADDDAAAARDLFKKAHKTINKYLTYSDSAYLTRAFEVAMAKDGRDSCEFFLESHKNKFWTH